MERRTGRGKECSKHEIFGGGKRKNEERNKTEKNDCQSRQYKGQELPAAVRGRGRRQGRGCGRGTGSID